MRPYANVRFERAFGGWLRRSHKRPNAAFVIRRRRRPRDGSGANKILTTIYSSPDGSFSTLSCIVREFLHQNLAASRLDMLMIKIQTARGKHAGIQVLPSLQLSAFFRLRIADLSLSRISLRFPPEKTCGGPIRISQKNGTGNHSPL